MTEDAAEDVPLPFYRARKKWEREYIAAALRRTKGNVSEAAKELGVNRTHIFRLMKRAGLPVNFARPKARRPWNRSRMVVEVSWARFTGMPI